MTGRRERADHCGKLDWVRSTLLVAGALPPQSVAGPRMADDACTTCGYARNLADCLVLQFP